MLLLLFLCHERSWILTNRCQNTDSPKPRGHGSCWGRIKRSPECDLAKSRLRFRIVEFLEILPQVALLQKSFSPHSICRWVQWCSGWFSSAEPSCPASLWCFLSECCLGSSGQVFSLSSDGDLILRKLVMICEDETQPSFTRKHGCFHPSTRKWCLNKCIYTDLNWKCSIRKKYPILTNASDCVNCVVSLKNHIQVSSCHSRRGLAWLQLQRQVHKQSCCSVKHQLTAVTVILKAGIKAGSR